MNLSQTSIGELYQSLSPKEIRLLGVYIARNAPKKTLLFHNALTEMAETRSLEASDYTTLKKIVFGEGEVSTSLMTSHINILQNIFKEFVVLSKTKEKNLYTDIVWGEYLVERKLHRSLQIKTSAYKLDLFKDAYPLQKEYYHVREKLLMHNLLYSSKKIDNFLSKSIDEIYALENYYISKVLESLITYTTFQKTKGKSLNEKIEKKINEKIILGLKTKNEFIEIQTLILSIYAYNSLDSFYKLINKFILLKESFSSNYCMYISQTIISYGNKQIDSGSLIISDKIYSIYRFLIEKNYFFLQGFLNFIHFNRYISLELKHGSIETAQEFLNQHIDKIPAKFRESSQLLNQAKIHIAQKEFLLANRCLMQINTNDSALYFVLVKIFLLKSLASLNDSEGVISENENFYRHFHKNKNIPEENIQRYQIFHKCIEYMAEDKFAFITPYYFRLVEKALNPESPYFNEKEWMQQRWKELKAKYKR